MRKFLALASLLVCFGLLVLASCGPTPTPVAALPTETPVPAGTLTPKTALTRTSTDTATPNATLTPSPTRTSAPSLPTATSTRIPATPIADIEVTTVADTVNGSGGISLRDAILSSNHAPGPHTITFAPDLGGQTIALRSPLPPITRDQITIVGLTKDGRPTITLDATKAVNGPVLFVLASHFSVSGLNFVSAPPSYSIIEVGGSAGMSNLPAPQRITDVRISGNAFSGLDGSCYSYAIHLRTTLVGKPNATIANVVISNNSFDRIWEAVNVECGGWLEIGGNSSLVENVVIEGNRFSRITSTFRSDGAPIEISGGRGRSNQVRGTRILHNVFTEGFKGIDLNNNNGGREGTTASGNLIDDTLIEGNVFMASHHDISFVAGVDAATGNTIANTRIINNLFIHSEPWSAEDVGIAMQDNDNVATGNKITNVLIANNTITGRGSGGVAITSGGGVTGVTILNTILGHGAWRGIVPEQVYNCITSEPGFAGVNGNIAGDARFVNPAQGDFHLQAGSPAIDAGSGDGAPPADLECRRRGRAPDIGAFEFGSTPLARLALITTGTGQGTVNADPVGLDCGGGTLVGHDIGTVVTLTPVPAAGSIFVGWSGDPDCVDGAVTMDTDKTCTATFLD